MERGVDFAWNDKAVTMNSENITTDRVRLREHQLGKELWRITHALADFIGICDYIRNLGQINFSKDSPLLPSFSWFDLPLHSSVHR